MVKRFIAGLIALSLFALVGVSGANAAETTVPVVKKVALTPEQKAAFEAAKTIFRTAQIARQNAISAAHSTIATAMAVRNAAVAAATTAEAKKAARDTFKAAVAAARASIPAKSVRPARP